MLLESKLGKLLTYFSWALFSCVSYYYLQSALMSQPCFFPNTKINLLSKRVLVPLPLDVLKKDVNGYRHSPDIISSTREMDRKKCLKNVFKQPLMHELGKIINSMFCQRVFNTLHVYSLGHKILFLQINHDPC